MKDDPSISQESDLAWASNSMASTTSWFSLWLAVCRHCPECLVCSILSPALWGTWDYPHWPARSSNHREVDYATSSHMATEAQSWIWLNNLGPGFPFYLFLIETIQLKTQTSAQLILPLAQPAILQSNWWLSQGGRGVRISCFHQTALCNPGETSEKSMQSIDVSGPALVSRLLSINLVLHPTNCGRFPSVYVEGK